MAHTGHRTMEARSGQNYLINFLLRTFNFLSFVFNPTVQRINFMTCVFNFLIRPINFIFYFTCIYHKHLQNKKWRFLICNYFCEISKFRDFMNTLRNFAKSVLLIFS